MEGDCGGRLSRRELIAGALVAGGTGALLGALEAAAQTGPVNDGTLLSNALEVERLGVLAYRRVITLPALAGPPRRLLRQLLHHERAHARSLEQELGALGIPLPPAPAGYAQVDQALSEHGMAGNLAGVASFKDAIQLLLDVEALCEGAYYTAIGLLSATGPLVRAAQTLASEAQHSALLAQLLYPAEVSEYVPDWYVAGVS